MNTNQLPEVVNKIHKEIINYLKDNPFDKHEFDIMCSDIEADYDGVCWASDNYCEESDEYTVIFEIGEEKELITVMVSDTYSWIVNTKTNEVKVVKSKYTEKVIDIDIETNQPPQFTDKELLAILALSYMACPEPAYSVCSKVLKYFGANENTTPEDLGVTLEEKIDIKSNTNQPPYIDIELHIKYENE